MSHSFKKLVRLDDRVFWIDLSNDDNWEFKELKPDGSSIDGTTAEFLDAVENGATIGDEPPNLKKDFIGYKYEVFIDDNFDYLDTSRRYKLGDFVSLKDAIDACKRVVDNELSDFAQQCAEEGKEGELYDYYTSFGSDPFIMTDDPNTETVPFSAWDYAKENCVAMAAAESAGNLDISGYKTVGDFYNGVKAHGYSLPVQMCHGLSQLMEVKNLNFPQAYEFLVKNKKIMLVNFTYIYDLSAPKLWEKSQISKL